MVVSRLLVENERRHAVEAALLFALKIVSILVFIGMLMLCLSALKKVAEKRMGPAFAELLVRVGYAAIAIGVIAGIIKLVL